MGYDVHQFAETIDINLVCSICGSVFENPVLTPCGHSFCLMCLETWLLTSSKQQQQQQPPQLLRLHYQQPRSFPSTCQSTITPSCPECREPVQPKEAKPEIALRNLINGYYMFCPFRKNGCYVMTKLEQLKNHESKCPHSPIECASCGTIVRMVNLAEHQIRCQGLAALIEDSDDSYDIQEYTAPTIPITNENTTVECTQLLEMMQEQMSFLKNDLADANDIVQGSKYCRKVKQINKKGPKSLTDTIPTFSHQESTKNKGIGQSDNNNKSNCSGLNWFEYPINEDSNRKYSYLTSPSIPATKMAAFIFRYLLNKPTYIDSRRVFRAIQEYYDDFTISSHLYDNAVHVIVATALASNWFTEMQRNCLSQWQQSLMKCHELLESTVHINSYN